MKTLMPPATAGKTPTASCAHATARTTIRARASRASGATSNFDHLRFWMCPAPARRCGNQCNGATRQEAKAARRGRRGGRARAGGAVARLGRRSGSLRRPATQGGGGRGVAATSRGCPRSKAHLYSSLSLLYILYLWYRGWVQPSKVWSPELFF